MSRFLILSEKKWHVDLFLRLQKVCPSYQWYIIQSKSDFTLDNLEKIKPSKIFIPHWSYIINKTIYEKYECIVFHITDLPFGRGGSPLQNLIVRGWKETKISAIKINEGIDTGDIYLKEPLSLKGTAREIFERAVPIIQKMIEKIIAEKIEPKAQTGQPVVFQRRKPDDSNLAGLTELEKIYDYIRMLDCEGYPNAFIETKDFKFDFSDAQFNEEQNTIHANVRIYKK